MVELAEIFQRYGPTYREKFRERMPWSHRQAMQAIEQCRTEHLGGHVYQCHACDEVLYSYHSCKNRHCPKCQNEAADQWLARQQALLLPVTHFLVTFTLPAELRPLARRHQKLIYNLLFRTSAAALQQLARDPRFVGGQLGMVGVLHTWGRALSYHPHVHYLVPGGGLAADGQHWRPSRKSFLVHVKPLSKLFRAKFRDELKKTNLFDQVPAKVWHKEWVVHSKAVDNGQAALKYLAPYIFRVAISNKRIVKLTEGKVTFRYTPSGSKKSKLCTLPAEEFIRRFLQHVLPKGFVKVRYYGLFSPGNRHLLKQASQLLGELSTAQPLDNDPVRPVTIAAPGTETRSQDRSVACPKCGQPMRLVQTLKTKRCRSPDRTF